MFQIRVELPHVRDQHTFGKVTGWVSRKGERYPGLMTLLQPERESDSVVKFTDYKKAKIWAKRNIWDPKAIVVIVDATMHSDDRLEDSVWNHKVRWV